MSTITATSRLVKPHPVSAATDQAKTLAARQAQGKALAAIDRAINACKQLARTGTSNAAREARLLAKMLFRISDPLYQSLTPVFQEGRWVR